MFDFSSLFKIGSRSRARHIVTNRVRKGQSIAPHELAAADGNVVVDPDGRVNLPVTLQNMRERPHQDQDVHERNTFNFRAFAGGAGATAFSGAPTGLSTHNAARLLSIDDAMPIQKSRLERLPFAAFEAEISTRDSAGLRNALNELDPASANLENLMRGLDGDPVPAAWTARADDVEARRQRVLSALDKFPEGRLEGREFNR